MSFYEDIRDAKRPAILVGGGAYKARATVEALASLANIPVFRTWNALDIATDDWPTYCGTIGTYGGPGRNFGVQNCDLLISLGCRMSGRITGGMPETFARGAKKWIIDIDPVAVDPKLQQVKGDENRLADVGQCVNAMIDYLRELPGLTFKPWLDQCREWLFKYDPVKPEMLTGYFHHYGFMRRLSEVLPANALITGDTGGNVIMMGHCFRSKRGQRIFSSNGNSNMGFSMCGAIGAWFAQPERPIICIIGDGGFNFYINELQTLVNYGVPIKVFVINNKILGNTKSYQRVNGMAEVACGPDGYKPPNFSKVVTAYGIPYYAIKFWGHFSLVEDVLKREGPVVCDVIHDDFCDYAPRISAWDVGIEDAFPFLPRDEFRANMIGVEPLPGWENKK